MKTKLIEMGEIKFKELAANIKVLNDSGMISEKINAIGKTKGELVDLFVDRVQGIPDDENGNWTGPEEVAAYYMTLLSPETKDKSEAKAAKTLKPVKDKGKKSKEGKAAGPGVIATIFDLIKTKAPITIPAIKEALAVQFADRDQAKMAKTVYAQIGGKKRPLRMETEKNVTFEINDKGEFSIQ
jgi:hypothetical protein